MIKILHFSDAHIDIASHGKRDPQSGLPVRVMDFLKALDTIIDTAIQDKVDLVLFSGDAYKDRTPVPTFQREWGKRIIRLSQAKIPTILLVGNHDISPTIGRASALQEFDTLDIPFVRLIGKPCLIKPNELYNLPVQIIALPWITRSGYLSTLNQEELDLTNLDSDIEGLLSNLIENLIKELDPDLANILTAHASIQGAVYGEERSIMLGQDMVIPLSFVKKDVFDYVALGH
ncbi:MAG TPA: exonuclease subunit SbcD, partial [Anaerolineaceae bacterium]|nr:exonuclease subunit SbcD [Anaerolineaceae bacterium]